MSAFDGVPFSLRPPFADFRVEGADLFDVLGGRDVANALGVRPVAEGWGIEIFGLRPEDEIADDVDHAGSFAKAIRSRTDNNGTPPFNQLNDLLDWLVGLVEAKSVGFTPALQFLAQSLPSFLRRKRQKLRVNL